MKRILISCLMVLVTSSVWAFTANEQALLLKPSMEQRFASNLATRFLTNWHYKNARLDDQLSSEIFDAYIELLDPGRSYFLASDVAMFERYRGDLDDALRHSELSPAYEIFNLYSDRVQQRVKYALERVQQPFDFNVEEDYQYDRTELSWPTTQQELDELWRKRVKNDYLRLKLTDKEESAIVETLTERYENLNRRVTELNAEDVFQFFMNAFAQSIEPHTSYLSPRTSENFEISMKLSLEGIGALLQRETEYTSIARVVPGGPADKDGRLKAGDRVVAVGQGREGKMVDVIGWRVDDVVDLIRGPKDTTVRLDVLPADAGMNGMTHTIDLVRNEVQLEEQAAQSEVIEVPKDNGEVVKIGVIDLPVFYIDFNGRATNRENYRSSTRDVQNLIQDLKEQGVEGIVMDLRNNGGGSLLEATTLTGLFIDKGPVVQVRDSRGRVSVESDEDAGMAWTGPLAVLVNRYSASASEIFAAAIQDYGRGLVIGEPTFGKGTVQSLLDLDDYAPSDTPGMGQLKITMAQFFRVNGGSTQNKGVVPDIRFPSAGDPQEYGERSLDHALPWTKIDAARYMPVDNIDQLVAVADSRYQQRAEGDKEFGWLLSDIQEYNDTANQKSVSLLETARREEIAEREEKRKLRKAEREGVPVESLDEAIADAADEVPVPGDVIDGEVADVIDAATEDEEEEEEGPDLLLRESARIVADMILYAADRQLLAKQFSQLNEQVKDGNRESPLD